MANYIIIKKQSGEILSIHRDDGVNFPVCEGNRDYQQYLEDIASGVVADSEVLQEAESVPSLQEQISTIAFLMGVS